MQALPYGMPPPPPMHHQHYGYPDPSQQYNPHNPQHSYDPQQQYDPQQSYDPLQQHQDNPQTSYTAAPQLNQGPGFDVVAAGGAAFAQKLAMANLAQHLAGNDPSKQEAAIAGVKVSVELVLLCVLGLRWGRQVGFGVCVLTCAGWTAFLCGWR